VFFDELEDRLIFFAGPGALGQVRIQDFHPALDNLLL
jgi:hypothetical protein